MIHMSRFWGGPETPFLGGGCEIRGRNRRKSIKVDLGSAGGCHDFGDFFIFSKKSKMESVLVFFRTCFSSFLG